MLIDHSNSLLTPSVAAFVEEAAASSLPVLLVGETGTGKSLLARMIHEQTRVDDPLVTVPCGALPPNLLERELFGHERGAFTGADRAAAGLAERAHGGSLLLDDVDALSVDLQTKLLHLADAGQIRRLGSTTWRSLRVRILSTTNADLAAAVAEQRFRKDLLFRLAFLQLSLPPLRERTDFEDVVNLYHREIGQARPGEGRRPAGMTHDAMDLLRGHDWPGNFRELHAVLARAIARADGSRLSAEHVRAALRTGLTLRSHGGAAGAPARPKYVSAFGADEERRRIVNALKHADGVKADAAARLGMSRQTLWMKEKVYAITQADWTRADA